MQFSEFKRRLKRLNPHLVIVPGAGKASGIYVRQNGHEDASLGLVFVCGMPSQTRFFNLPERNFFDEKSDFHRGIRTVVSLLASKGHVNLQSAMRTFGWAAL